MNDKEILQHVKEYLYSLAKSKPYNIQCMALKNYMDQKFSADINDYFVDYSTFCDKHINFCVRDIVYKKDYYTPRDMYLIAPEHYIYYTYYVFKFFWGVFLREKRKCVDFSSDYVKVFYSGSISFEKGISVSEYSIFNNSYRKFQKEKEKFLDHRVLKIDIQDFFKNIPTCRLIKKMKKLCEKNVSQSKFDRYMKDIINIEKFYIANNFTNLPQLHYSIASSALSQFYLSQFSYELDITLEKESLRNDSFLAVRFVDDMYIKIPSRKRIKSINNMINSLTTILWKENLNLNTKKVKIMSASEYKKDHALVVDSVEDISIFTKIPMEEKINDKVEDLLENKAIKLKNFLEELVTVERKNGVSIEDYHKIVDKYISIEGEHATKIINGLMFGAKWKGLDANILNEILCMWQVLQFNPKQFTTFFLLIYTHLSFVNNLKNNFWNELIDRLDKQDFYTLRDGIIVTQCIIQRKSMNPKLLNDIFSFNKEYIMYIENYVLKS